jgi:hypothetical protein
VTCPRLRLRGRFFSSGVVWSPAVTFAVFLVAVNCRSYAAGVNSSRFFFGRSSLCSRKLPRYADIVFGEPDRVIAKTPSLPGATVILLKKEHLY